MKSAGLSKTEMAGRNLSVPYAPPGAKRIDDDEWSYANGILVKVKFFFHGVPH